MYGVGGHKRGLGSSRRYVRKEHGPRHPCHEGLCLAGRPQAAPSGGIGRDGEVVQGAGREDVLEQPRSWPLEPWALDRRGQEPPRPHGSGGVVDTSPEAGALGARSVAPTQASTGLGPEGHWVRVTSTVPGAFDGVSETHSFSKKSTFPNFGERPHQTTGKSRAGTLWWGPHLPSCCPAPWPPGGRHTGPGHAAAGGNSSGNRCSLMSKGQRPSRSQAEGGISHALCLSSVLGP